MSRPDRWLTFVGRPVGFALVLGVALAIFLLAVGLNAQSLPFIPGAAYSDAVISHWPNALFFQRTMQSGTFPLWRPLLMSGQPFATNPLNKVWYPFEWALLIVPPILYLNATLWLHLLLAGVGLRALARQLDLPVEIASFVGVVYAFTPRLIALSGAGHWDAVAAWAWLPWLLWAVTDVRLRWRWIAIFGALCFLGDVRTAALGFALAGAFALWRSLPSPPLPPSPVERRGSREVPRLGATGFRVRAAFLAVIMLIGLTAVQWLPLLVTIPGLSRGGLTIADAGVFSLAPTDAVGLLFSVRGGSQETMVYVGVGVLALAILGGIAAGRAGRFWIGVIGVAGLYALGANGFLWPILVRIAPPLLWLRVPARAWQIGILAVIMLSGYGLQIVLDPVKRAAHRRLITRLSTALIMAGVLLALIVLPVAPTSAVIALIMVIGCGGLLLIRLKDRRRSYALWLGLIAFDLLLMDTSLLQGRDRSQWLDAYQPLAQALTADHALKVYASPEVLPQPVAAYWQIPTFGGVDPFQFTTYVTLNRQINPLIAADYSVVLPNFPDGVTNAQWGAVLDLKLLAQWQVTHIVTDAPVTNPDLKLVDQVTVGAQQLYIYTNGRYQAGRSITWTDANHVIQRADDTPDGVLPDLHGWTRTVSADGIATYSYAPPELFIGVGLSALTVVLLLGSWLPLFLRRRSLYKIAATVQNEI